MTRLVQRFAVVSALALSACSLDTVGNVDENDVPIPMPGVDAGPIYLCQTSYAASGDVTHTTAGSGTACTIVPGQPDPCGVAVEGEFCFDGACALESCEGNGLWTLSLASPEAAEGETACDDAPSAATLQLQVTIDGRNFTAVDQDDTSRMWTGQMADKGGSCSGNFELLESDGKTRWSIHAVEAGPDGALSGTAHFEVAK